MTNEQAAAILLDTAEMFKACMDGGQDIGVDERDVEACDLGAAALRLLDKLEKWAKAKKQYHDTDPRGKGTHSILFAEFIQALHCEMEWPPKEEPK